MSAPDGLLTAAPPRSQRLWRRIQAHIAGQARFVVVENLLCAAGDAGKFLVFQWEDLGPGGLARSTR